MTTATTAIPVSNSQDRIPESASDITPFSDPNFDLEPLLNLPVLENH